MKRRLLAIFLSLTLMLSLIPTAWAVENGEPDEVSLEGTCGSPNTGSVKWELEQNNDSSESPTYTLTISGEGAMADYEANTTPWGVAIAYKLGLDPKTDATVVSGQASAHITQVNIGNGITYIGTHAFRSTGIKTISIPDSVTSIGKYAFIRCADLEEFVASDDAVEGRDFFVQDGVLYERTENDLELRFYPAAKTTGKFTIPDGVTKLGVNSLQDAKLSAVNIPDSVTDIGNYAFCGAMALTGVDLPENLTSIGNGAFLNCPSLVSVSIPNSVTQIGSWAFSKTKITDITIPASVQTIGDRAFETGDPALIESITLNFEAGSQLSKVGAHCFNNVPQYTANFQKGDLDPYSIFISAGYQAKLDGMGELPTDPYYLYAWAGENELAIVDLTPAGKELTEINIPDTAGDNSEYKVTKIAANVFGHSDQNQPSDIITKVVIGSNIVSIGDNAFQRCGKIAAIDFSKATSLETIGDSAFYMAGRSAGTMKSIDLSACTSLKSVGTKAFWYSSTQTLLLPQNITAWGESVLDNSSKAVVCSDGTPTMTTVQKALVDETDKFGIKGSYEGLEYYVVAANGELTVQIIGFADDATDAQKENLVIPDDIGGVPVTNIANDAFNVHYEADFVKTKSVKIGANVTNIGAYAFASDNGVTTNLESVEFKSGVPVTVGTRAFQKQYAIKSFEAGDRELTLGDRALFGSAPLNLVNIPNAKSLDTGVFYYRGSTVGTLVINGEAIFNSTTFMGDPSNSNGSSIRKMTIYALGDASKVKDEVKALGGTDSNILCLTDGGSFKADTTFTAGQFATPEKSSYKFEGWYVKNDDESWGTTAEETPVAGKTYYAKWSESTYTVSNNAELSYAYGEAPTAKEIKVTTTDEDASIRTATTSSQYFNVAVNSLTITVTPASGLNAGEYKGTIVVTTGDGATHTIAVTLTVSKANSAITPSENSSNIEATYGDTIKLVAKVRRDTSTGIALMTAEDTVDFVCNETTLGSATVDWAGETGTATLNYDTSEGGIPVGGAATVTVEYGGNSNLNTGSGKITVTLARKELTVTGLSATNRAYEAGNTKVALKGGTLSGVVGQDEVKAIIPAEGTMTDADVGTGKTVNFTITLSGADKEKYTLVEPTVTVDITKATPTVMISADQTSLVGGGTIKLTVSGVPEGGTVTVTQTDDRGSEAKTLDLTANGEISVRLSNTTAKYTFTVVYAGDDNYNESETSCEVSVTRRSSSAANPGNTVSVPSTPNGTVTVNPSPASKGETVTITTKPSEGYELGSIEVLDKNGDALKLKDLGNGKYSFAMPDGKVSVEAEFVKAASTSFADVPANAYFADAVEWAVNKGITNGLTDTMFGPYESCTRAQIVTFLWRAAGSPEPKAMSSFSDVPTSAYYAKAVAWAVENGITNGMSETTFAPDVTCTRGQSVTFLYRALKGTASGSANFTDVASDAFYADAVNWAVANNVTNGTSATTFSPDASCTRAEIVTFLYRAYQGK